MDTGKKDLPWPILCWDNNDIAVDSCQSLCCCFPSLPFWESKEGFQMPWHCPGEPWYFFSAALGRHSVQEFCIFWATKQSFFLFLFFLVQAEMEKLQCFPALSRASMNNFPLAKAVSVRPFVPDIIINVLLWLHNLQPFFYHTFCWPSDVSSFVDLFPSILLLLWLWDVVLILLIYIFTVSLFIPHPNPEIHSS